MKKQGLMVTAKVAIIIIVATFLAVGFVNPVFGYESPDYYESVDVSSDGKKGYLIGFYQEPAGMEVNKVELFGGEVYRQFSLVNVVAARLTPEAASRLEKEQSVKYIEVDAPVFASGQEVPWGIKRVFGNKSYPFETWDFTKGSNIAVAILDTGIDANHEDLHSLILGGINTVQGDNTNDYNDGHGHGTHVAGTVAALDNELGVVGVSPEAGLYAVKVLDNLGRGSWSTVVAGIEWVVEQNIPIMNMSFGGADGRSLRDACNAAYSAGHILVAAAGNSGNYSGTGNNVAYPAGYSSVIAVAASDQNDNRSFFSSTGPEVELIAPGQRILSTWRLNRYIMVNGTSMASPHVSGCAALTWAVNPDLTNVQVREILQETAEDINLPVNHQGKGMARADLAVKAALELVGPKTGNIEGIVTGKESKPIEGASVTVEDIDLEVITDQNGYYRIEEVPEGEQAVSVSADEYYSETIVVNVENDETITQDFSLEWIIPKHTIVATAGPGGAIEPSEAVSVYQGDNQTFTITPDADFVIDKVLVDEEPVEAVNSYTFESVSSDHTIHAEFSAIPAYTITGRVKNNSGDQLVGASVIIEEADLSVVTDDEGSYELSGIKEGTYTITASKEGYIKDTKEVKVSKDTSGVDFKLRRKNNTVYTITASAGKGGNIKPSAAVAVYEGDSQSFAISPDAGYIIGDLLVDEESIGAIDSYTFENVSSDHSIHAEFKVIPTYTISGKVTNNDGAPLDRAVVILHGRWLIAITEPDGSYEFSGLKEGTYKVSALMNDYDFKTREITVTEDTSDVDFVLIGRSEPTYKITPSAGSGGQVSPLKAVTVNAGDSITFNIKPNAGYIIGDVLVDGQSVNPVDSYTFNNVNSDHTIKAEFVATSSYSLMWFFDIFNFNKQDTTFDHLLDPWYSL